METLAQMNDSFLLVAHSLTLLSIGLGSVFPAKAGLRYGFIGAFSFTGAFFVILWLLQPFLGGFNYPLLGTYAAIGCFAALIRKIFRFLF